MKPERPQLLTGKCATCVFHPGNRMHLAEGRLKDLVDSNLATGSLLTCHSTLEGWGHDEVGEAMCRGFWDAYGDRTRTKQVMDRMFGPAWYDEIAPPGVSTEGEQQQMDEIYVVVTIADNGIVHAWGKGPVVGGQVTPFDSRAEARREAEKFRRQDAREYPDKPRVTVKACKVLGTTSVPVETPEAAERSA